VGNAFDDTEVEVRKFAIERPVGGFTSGEVMEI
jgi:hypothetical protein